MTGSRFIVVGGAGFIGSHFADRLLADAAVARVTIYDNFSSGREWHLSGHLADPRLSVVRAGVEDLGALTRAMDGHDTVIHLASNPDIAKAIAEPAIDFDQGTLLTHHVVEAARRTGARQILYASGSGVYTAQQATLDAQPVIRVPTVFACGTADACNLPESSLGQERWFANGYERVEVEGAGHFIQREDPELIAALLRRQNISHFTRGK